MPIRARAPKYSGRAGVTLAAARIASGNANSAPNTVPKIARSTDSSTGHRLGMNWSNVVRVQGVSAELHLGLRLGQKRLVSSWLYPRASRCECQVGYMITDIIKTSRLDLQRCAHRHENETSTVTISSLSPTVDVTPAPPSGNSCVDATTWNPTSPLTRKFISVSAVPVIKRFRFLSLHRIIFHNRIANLTEPC